MIRPLVLLVVLSTAALGAKDNAYYPNGITNPNIKRQMYWHDASNVLTDLSQFSELYVQFHACAWSPILSNQREGGGGQDENDYWYMNAMPSFGANVAYSLYGSLAGDEFVGCSKKSYINSFYTTSGFTNFATALATAGIDNTGTTYSYSCDSGVGISCSDNGNNFVMTTYNNGVCRPENAKKSSIPSDLASFNTVLKSNDAKCVRIYSAADGDSAPGLLQYSRSCATSDVVGVCADPYGKKSAYERELAKATSPSALFRTQTMQASIMYVVGAVLFAAAALLAREGTKSYPIPASKARHSSRRHRRRGSRTKSPRGGKERSSSRRDKKSSSNSPKKSKRRSKHRDVEEEDVLSETEAAATSYREFQTPDKAFQQEDHGYLASLPSDDADVQPEVVPIAAASENASGRSRASRAVDAPPGPAIPLARSLSFASARSNIEVQAPVTDDDDDGNDSEHFDNEWGSKPKSSSRSIRNGRSAKTAIDVERSAAHHHSSSNHDGLLGGLSSWLANGANNNNQSSSRGHRTAAASQDVIMSPSFLSETDGDESGPESSRTKGTKIRRFMAMRRKSQR